MRDKYKPDTVTIKLNLSALDVRGLIELAAVIAEMAPKSPLYGSSAVLKTAVDVLATDGVDLSGADEGVANKWHDYQMALSHRTAIQTRLIGNAGVLKAVAQTVCKTDEDVVSLALRRRNRIPWAELVCPTLVTAKPGKELGSFSSHARRIARLSKYIAQVSPTPFTETSWVTTVGTNARRTFAGYESGKLYWVRWCTERGSQRSPWSDPVAVTAR